MTEPADAAEDAGGIFAVDHDGRFFAIVRAAAADEAIERTVSMVDCSCRERLDPRRLSARDATEAEAGQWLRFRRDHLLDCPAAAIAVPTPRPAPSRKPPVGFPGAERQRDRQRRNARTLALAIVGISCFAAAGMAAVGIFRDSSSSNASSEPSERRANPPAGAGDTDGPAWFTKPGSSGGSSAAGFSGDADGAAGPLPPAGGNAGPNLPGVSGVPSNGFAASGGGGGQRGSPSSVPLVLADSDSGSPVTVVPPDGTPLPVAENSSLGEFGTGRAGLPSSSGPQPSLPPQFAPPASGPFSTQQPKPPETGTQPCGVPNPPSNGSSPVCSQTQQSGGGDKGGTGEPVQGGNTPPNGGGSGGGKEAGGKPGDKAPGSDNSGTPDGGGKTPTKIPEPPVWALLATVLPLSALLRGLGRRRSGGR